jgi:hypothetical protein
MLALLGSLLGFTTSVIPSLIGIWEKKVNIKNEILLLEARSKFQIAVAESKADIEESKGLYDHAKSEIEHSAKWVTTLSATCRPFITYLFLGFYLTAKTLMITQSYQQGEALTDIMNVIYTSDDIAIMAAIICFWFGSRQFRRLAR